MQQTSKASHAIGADSLTVEVHCSVEEMADIVPIKLPAILKFLHQARRIESIARLPELQHDEAADECLIERPSGEHAEVVDVAGLVALIAGAGFLGKNLGEWKTDDSADANGRNLKYLCSICASRSTGSVGVSRRLIWSL